MCDIARDGKACLGTCHDRQPDTAAAEPRKEVTFLHQQQDPVVVKNGEAFIRENDGYIPTDHHSPASH